MQFQLAWRKERGKKKITKQLVTLQIIEGQKGGKGGKEEGGKEGKKEREEVILTVVKVQVLVQLS